MLNPSPVFTLSELARLVDGRVIGDGEVRITAARPFETASDGHITFVSSKKYLEKLSSCRASALLVGSEISGVRNQVIVGNPKLAFALALQAFSPEPFEAQGISPQACVRPTAKVAGKVTIYPFVWVGDDVEIEEEVTLFPGVSVGDGCRVGRGSVLHAGVVLYPRVRLGERVILHSGTVIGADGFGYVADPDRRQVKIPQTGTVEIGDDVEIGANSCVDRATFGATVIERGVKIDNHVHIGHNCRIGENTVIVGCVGISGSVQIGRNCILTGQVGVVDHVRIGDDVIVMMKSAVDRDVPAGQRVSGIPAREHRQQLKSEALIRRLPEIYGDVKRLKKILKPDPANS